MATAALDALQDVAGGRSQSIAQVVFSDAATPLQPGKLDFYQSVVAQLLDDGLVEEAKSLAYKLNVPPGDSSGNLFQAFVKQREFARLHPNETSEWVALRPRPLPPIGPQEKLLDLSVYADGKRDTAMDDEDDEPEDVMEELAREMPVPLAMRVKFTSQHKQAVRSVAFSADGRLCASGSMDTSIKIMDTSKMRMHGLVHGQGGAAAQAEEMRPVVRTFYDHVGTVSSLAFHPRLPILFTGSADKTVKIFDLTKGGVNKKAQGSISDVGPITVVAPHACGDYLLVGTPHPVVRLYDTTTQQCFSSYFQGGHSGGINDVKCASDGSVFASASADGSILLWDGVGNKITNKLVGAHNGHPVFSLQWSRNNRYLLSSGGDLRARLWDMRTGKLLLVYAPQPLLSSCSGMVALFTHNEETLVSVSSESNVSETALMDARTGSILVPQLGAHVGATARCLAVSPTEQTFSTGCEDSKVRYIEIVEDEE